MAVTELDRRIMKFHFAFASKNHDVAERYSNLSPLKPLQRDGRVYNNTYLHLAIRQRQFELVHLLVEKLTMKKKEDKDWESDIKNDGEGEGEEEEEEESLSNIKNDEGDTILHELAADDRTFHEAKKVVEKDPGLLTALNNLGETPLFVAARHGLFSLFHNLATELMRLHPQDYKTHLQRRDGTTVLHVAVTAEQFEMACSIADRFKSDLAAEKDEDGMTAFQYLACNPMAFGKTKKAGEGFLEDAAIGWKRTKDQPFWKRFKKLVVAPLNSYRFDIEELVSKLAMHDNSWLTGVDSQTIGSSKGEELEGRSRKPEIKMSHEMNMQGPRPRNDSNTEFIKSDESPLFLAIMSNIPDIVEKLLRVHPEAIRQNNKDGMNILQVAILYGNVEIFDLIVKIEMLPNSLLSATDDEGNSLLHIVSQNQRSLAGERMQNPAIQLRKECIFFQKVKAACNMHLKKPLNKRNQTAEELFAARNEQLHKEAKEWLMRTTESCTMLSVFIATVAFAAAYTVPGGPDQNTGIPIMNSKPWFVVFIIADLISLAFALTSVGIFLSLLTSSFPLQHFENYLFQKLRRGIICMVLSVSMMGVAFGATIVLAMTHNWENAGWIVVGFLPVPIFFLSYSPLRSAVLGPYLEMLVFFAAKCTFGAMVLLYLLIGFLPEKALEGLRWTKDKLDSWNCRQKSQSPQPAIPV